MTYEQLEKIEIYNAIAQFNKDILNICEVVNYNNGHFDYYNALNGKLTQFKSIIPINIDNITLKFNLYNIEYITIYKNGGYVDLELTDEIGFNIFETEYSMDIFEPEDITAGVILEAFIAARNNGVSSHIMKLSGIDDNELNVLNYDEIKDMLERLSQLDITIFNHKIEDDILIIDFRFRAPHTLYI